MYIRATIAPGSYCKSVPFGRRKPAVRLIGSGSYSIQDPTKRDSLLTITSKVKPKKQLYTVTPITVSYSDEVTTYAALSAYERLFPLKPKNPV